MAAPPAAYVDPPAYVGGPSASAGIRTPRWLFRNKAFLILAVLLLTFSGCVCRQDNRDDIRRQEVVEGGNLTLTCYAQAGQLREYRWVYIRAGTKRPQLLSSGRRLVVGEPRMSLRTRMEDEHVALELTLSDVRSHESGVFMCWRQGLKPDPQVLLTVLEPGTQLEQQVVRQAIGPSEVKYGDSASFTCIITPSWPVKVTWFKNGEEISASDRLYTQVVEKTNSPVGDLQIEEEKLVATLTITSVRKDSVFTCQINSSPPDQRDMPVKVLVPRVESLTTDPEKDIVEYGQPLAITCVVSGTDSEILWLKDGSELSFGAHTPGREVFASEEGSSMLGSTIYIDSLTFKDNGQYACYIPGASKTILINIEGRPPRLLGVTGGDFFEDDSLSLRCTVQYSKNSPGQDFRWQFKNADINPNLFQTQEYKTEYNVTVNELTIPRAGPQHVGTYNCITPYGTASIAINMFVPPSLGEPLPSEMRVREGDTLRVACKAIGSPLPTITWERNLGGGWLPISEINGIEIGHDGELLLPAASLGDAGEYRCAAQSEAGSFLAGVVVTVVRAGPEVFDIVAPESVVVGDNFTVQCTVINWDGEVNFAFHESSLRSQDNGRYQVASFPTSDGMTQVYLTVQDATLEDSGRYTCFAGSDTSSSTIVEVRDRPAEVLELTASDASQGQDFFITCIVSNAQEVAFYHNGFPIEERANPRYSLQASHSSFQDSTYVLKVISARPEDNGDYECVANNEAARSLTVIIGEAKDEVVSIEASPAILGRDFNVTCTVSNWDKEVTFIHNNAVIDNEKDWRYVVFSYPSETNDNMMIHTLMVSDVTEDDEGTYECYTTPIAHRSTVVSVWEMANVKLELQSRDRPNWRDSPIPIDCVVEGVDPDIVTILFSHFDDPQVSIQNRTKMTTADHLVNIAINENDKSPTHNTTFTLGFYSLSSDRTGVWSCTVILPSGDIIGKDTLFLEIEEPPEFEEKLPEKIFVDSDQDLMLNCSAKSSPNIIVAWYSVGIPDPIELRRQSATLFIPAFTAMDAGDYYCSASLLNREIRAKTTLVLRTPQPQVESVASSPAAPGEDLTVTCTVSHWNGQVLFLHNSESVDTQQNPRYVTKYQSHGRREPNTITHTLTIKDVTPGDAGVVECFISFEVYGSTNVTIIGMENPFSTSDKPIPTLAPGQIVELRGPDSVEIGKTLHLTCIISPVIQQQGIVLVHDVFLLHVGGVTISEDPRVNIVTDSALDGTRIIYLTIREVTEADKGEYQCATSTDPPAQAVKDIVIVDSYGSKTGDSGGGGVGIPDESSFDCSSYATCTECVSTQFPCKWCMSSHRCSAEIEEECSNDVIIYGQEDDADADADERSRAGPSYCPVITKNPTEILIHNGEKRSVYIDSKSIDDERTFDYAKFKCQFDMEGEMMTVSARLWYSHIYCDEASFYIRSSSPKTRVPIKVLWDDTKRIDNPSDVHVTVYSCSLMAESCEKCQDLPEEYKCGWCKTTENCEFDGRCPANEWLPPSDGCVDIASGVNFMLYGPEKSEVIVQPSDKVLLPCTVSVYFDLQEGFWNRIYNIKWTREVDGAVETIAENNFLDVSSYDRSRYTLDTIVSEPDKGKVTKYNLVIDPIQVSDFGVYSCSVTNANNITVSRSVTVTSGEPPQYDRCQLPDHWTGQWYATYDDYTIHGNFFGNTACISSLGNKYLLRNEDYECNMCFIIHEKHYNLLEYKESECTKEQDLNKLCSLVDDYSSKTLKRSNGAVECPFNGTRLFTYQRAREEECSQPPSSLISEEDSMELVFMYNQCTNQDNQNTIPYPTRVKCVANWEEGSINYLMTKLTGPTDSREQYYCFTFMEVWDEKYQYVMSRTGTETCGELEVDFEEAYKIFNEAKAPGQPIIEGYGSAIQVTEGYSLRLKCVSYGGVPSATLRWTRNNQELPSATLHHEDRSETVLDIEIKASDDRAEYRCDASNIATNFPLSVSTVLTFNIDQCELPSSWVGRWYQTNNDRFVDITPQEFSNNPCTASLGQSYRLYNEAKECNRCIIITEKHPNFLEYKKSRCRKIDDIHDLCSKVAEELFTLVRPEATIRCPFIGARSFGYQEGNTDCRKAALSKLVSSDTYTVLSFTYKSCRSQSNQEIYLSEDVQCIAGWNEGATHYLMGRLNPYDGTSVHQYRCFTYLREERGNQVYRMSRLDSPKCGVLGGEDAEFTYQIYGLSEAPSRPLIEGADITNEVGDTVWLTCSTSGGFPPPKLEWFKNGEIYPSEYQYQYDEQHLAQIRVQVTEADRDARYQCQVSNYATVVPLAASTTLKLKPKKQSLLQEPIEAHLSVFPADRVILNCTTTVPVDLSLRVGNYHRMEWTYLSGQLQETIAEMDDLVREDWRFSLDIEYKPEENATRFSLIIDPIQVSDTGVYECNIWDNSQSAYHRTYLRVGGSREYEPCDLPSHWYGEWLGFYEDYEINNNNISGRICQQSYGNKYFFRHEYLDCNECYVIDEFHPNLLKFRQSDCLAEDDLGMLCSRVEDNWQWMMKKHASTQCPFTGSRTFTYQFEYGGCSERPSKLYSKNGDTELVFIYSPCPDQNNLNMHTDSIEDQCLATWSEDSVHYLMSNTGNGFRCYTYKEVENEKYVYKMSQAESSTCGPLDSGYYRTYKIFDESVGPGQPVIQGFSESDPKEPGEEIQLLCVSYGGFPPATLNWFKDDEQVEADSHQEGDEKSESHMRVFVPDGGKEIKYRCEASNFATSVPLKTSIVISSFRGFRKILKSQVMALEGQNAFLPCARVTDKELQMKWFDADLDIKLTVGNDTIGNNDSLSSDSNVVPYIRKDLYGLIIKSGFFDTKYGCMIGDQKVGNTTLVILASFLIGEDTFEVSEYFEETETYIETNKNSEVTLNCTLQSGVIPSVVRWQRFSDSQLLTQDDINLAKDKGYELTADVESHSYILTIPSAAASHSGSYMCQMILNDKEVYTKNYTLSVQDVIKGNLSGNTSISCYSPLGEQISFLHNDEVLSPDMTDSAKYEWEEEASKEGGNVTTLTISDTTEDDGGVYTCVKSDNHSDVLQIVFIGFPNEEMLNISNLHVVEAMGTEVTLAWDPPTEDPFANIVSYEVAYFERGHENDAATLIMKNNTCLVPILEENTDYGFQVRVQTDMGWGAFSDIIYQKTGKHLKEDLESSTTLLSFDDLTTSSTTEVYVDQEEVEKEDKEAEEEDIIHTVEEEDPEPEEYYYPGEDYGYEDPKEEILPVVYKEVVLPCPGYTRPDDVTWMRGDELLFLGEINLAGIPGLKLSPNAELILEEGTIRDTRDDDNYTCSTSDPETYNDVFIETYYITLLGEETVVGRTHDNKTEAIHEDVENDSTNLQFDLDEKVAVLANSERVGKKIVEVLESGGMRVRLLDLSKCNKTDVRGWTNADQALQTCEAQARLSGDLTDEESIFMGIDFFVEFPSSWFAVTQLYLHNVKKDISVNVYAPMVPVPASNIIKPSQPNEPDHIQVTEDWWNTVQGVDKSVGSGLTASILSLQESYRNMINGQSSNSA